MSRGLIELKRGTYVDPREIGSITVHIDSEIIPGLRINPHVVVRGKSGGVGKENSFYCVIPALSDEEAYEIAERICCIVNEMVATCVDVRKEDV